MVSADAMRAAIPEYMRFPAIREMHQLSAAGTALEVEVGDDNITRLVAHVVDPIAVSKIKTRTYRGFSIGGRVTKRDVGNSKTITGLSLSEISLVDRPANPDSVFDVWKASSMPESPTATAAPFNAPIQIWACGDPDHQHIAKADAMRCLEKRATVPIKTAPGGDPDAPATAGDQEMAAAVLDAMAKADAAPEPTNDPESPPTEAEIEKTAADGAASAQAVIEAALQAVESGEIALAKTAPDPEPEATEVEVANPSQERIAATWIKSLWDIGGVAEVIGWLRALKERHEMEAVMEGDDSGLPNKTAEACGAVCELLQMMVAEETQEVLAGTEIDEPVGMIMSMAAKAIIAECLAKAIPDTAKVEHLMEALTKANQRHSAPHQAQLDVAAYAISKGIDVGGLKRAEMASGVRAHKAVLDAGATALNAGGREMLTDGNPGPEAGATQHATVDTGRNAQTAVPNATGAVPATPYPASVRKAAGADFEEIDAMVKAGKGAASLFSRAHDLLHDCSDGATCSEDAAQPVHLSNRDMALLHDAHANLMAIENVACAASVAAEGAAEPAGEAEAEVAVDTAKVADTAPAATTGTLTEKSRNSTSDLIPLAMAPPEQVWEVARLERDDLAKVLVAERAEKAALIKTVEAIVPMLDRLTKRVDQIAETPFPGRAHTGAGVFAVSKAQDGAPLGGGGGQQPSAEEIAAELAKMSKEDQTLHLIKKIQTNPQPYDRFRGVVA